MTQLYVANLAPEVGEEQLRGLFAPLGEVYELVLHTEEYTDQGTVKERFHIALVTLGSEKAATKAQNVLNGQLLEGRHLALSPAELFIRPLMPKQRQAFEELAEEMGETEKKPLRMLEAIITLCGVAFARAIFEEAKQVEAQGGLLTATGDKRRTLGGVFFYLARFRMSRPVRRIVYTRKGKFPMEQYPSADELSIAETV